MILLVLAGGGALGAVARYGLSGWVQSFGGASFPWGTLAVNIAGSLLLGLAYPLLEGTAVSPQTRAFVTIGFCGAFTTFSTFSYETIRLLEGGEAGRALLYATGSVVLCLAGTLGGLRLGALLLGRGT